MSGDGCVVGLCAGIPGPIVVEVVGDMRGVTDLSASRGRVRFRRLKGENRRSGSARQPLPLSASVRTSVNLCAQSAPGR